MQKKIEKQQRKKQAKNQEIKQESILQFKEKWENIQKLFRNFYKNEDTIEWQKEDLQEILLWTRFIISFVLGILFGLIPLTGFIAIALYLLVSVGFLEIYCRKKHHLDPEDFGSAFTFASAGLMPSSALFLLIWIIVYSNFNSI
ncbi:protein c20orf24 rab5-interacting protein [Anaeramoeba ignava]|uniref:Protein c20orf24 rab5-interacting protein n=1 Tax=Anaeramoeba ignava TaxID=1746090 RepID=A0A9Q0LL19_ANAIG|nr:protein c20orf24 rab5-interacting protein [Anaeramoeba ignava]